MVKGKVKLSVCMPVYNGSAYISNSIKSVLSQTYKDFHLLVFDNCSTDDTEGIVKQFKDPRIKYLRNETNLGLVGNHQRCIDFCETEYLNIWHDDDIMMPENLERKVAILENNSNVGLVFSNVDLIDENDNLHFYKWNEECKNNFFINGRVLFKKYIKRIHIGAFFFIGATIARKEVLVEAGGFNKTDQPLTCDSSLWLRSLLITDAACIGNPLVKYRNYIGQTCSDFYGVNYLREHFNVADKILDECKYEISDAKSLRKEVEGNFIIQAATMGKTACDKNDFESGHLYMEWAKKFSGKDTFDKRLLGLQARLLFGPKATIISRPLRKQIKKLF